MRLAETYAQALADIAARRREEQEELLPRFFALLRRRGHGALLPRIRAAYERECERRRRRSATVLSVARREDARGERTARALERRGIPREALTEQTDDTLIGGFRLEGYGYTLDASYKRMLQDLYRRITERI